MTINTVMITGGTGFFGKTLLRHWVGAFETGFVVPQVVVLSRRPAEFLSENPEFACRPWLSFVEGNILVPTSLPRLGGISHLIHAAADSTFGPQLTPIARFDQIVNGTRNVLNWAAAQGVRKVLFCSSGGVYGQPPPNMSSIDESFHGIPDPLVSQNAYSIGKRAAEHLCSLYAEQHGLEVVVARCFAFVGRDLPLDVHFAIGNFIRDALYRPAITVAGDGTAIRSYLDQRDLAVWLTALLERGPAGRAYNVGSDQAINMADLAQLVRDVLSPDKKVEILGKRPLDANRQVYVPSIERARRELGLDVVIPLRRAIEEAARFSREDIH